MKRPRQARGAACGDDPFVAFSDHCADLGKRSGATWGASRHGRPVSEAAVAGGTS